MALPTSYMTGGYTKIPQYFDTLLTARAPEKFTNKFMADLGFTSSTDRLFANVLKSIGFLDDSGVPTERYFKFLDQSCSKQMVAEGVREAYEVCSTINVTAYTMSQAEVEGKFKTLTNGSKGSCYNYTDGQDICCTLRLCRLVCCYSFATAGNLSCIAQTGRTSKSFSYFFARVSANRIDLNYDIHIHLPATRDQAVYDALFASLAKHIPLK